MNTYRLGRTCQNCALTTRAFVGGLFESQSFKWCRVWKQLKSNDHPVCSHFEPIDPEPEPEPEPKPVFRSTYDPTWAIEPDTPPLRHMNTTPDCHPDTPESGQQMRHYFKPIRYKMTATLTHKTSRAWRRLLSTKANKRRERRKAIKQMTYKLNRNDQ